MKFEKSMKKWKIYEWEDTVGVFLWSVRWGGTWGGMGGGTNFEKSLYTRNTQMQWKRSAQNRSSGLVLAAECDRKTHIQNCVV